MSDKIQISEKQAKNMLVNSNIYFYDNNSLNDVISKWKENGYIKKSLLDEARDYGEHLQIHYHQCNRNDVKFNIETLMNKFELAIDEIQEGE